MSLTRKPLRYVVSGALLVGSLSACGASEHPVNEPSPEIDEAEPEPNEHHGQNEAEPEIDPELNVLQAEPEPDEFLE